MAQGKRAESRAWSWPDLPTGNRPRPGSEVAFTLSVKTMRTLSVYRVSDTRAPPAPRASLLAQARTGEPGSTPR